MSLIESNLKVRRRIYRTCISKGRSNEKMTRTVPEHPVSPTPKTNGFHSAKTNGHSTHSGQHTHASKTRDTWAKVEKLKAEGKVLLNGSDLDIASVIAVAK